MRVLHITGGNLYGGIETLLATLARQRARCFFMETEFALCFRGRLYRELQAAGARVYSLGSARLRNPVSVKRACQRLKELLRHGSFDVAICHHVWVQMVFARTVRTAGLPLAFWGHSTLHGWHWMERLARLNVPDLVIYSSRFTAEVVPRIYSEIPTEVVHNPVAPFEGDPAADRFAVRAELRTPAGAVVVVQASRLEEWKGHVVHLKALAKLRDLNVWQCWIIGGAQKPHELQYLERLKGIAAGLGIHRRVCFLGQRHDVARLLNAADIYCQPNTAPEPFGIAFVEALYAHLPVVTTEIGGALEIVDDSCGVLVSADDPDALAACLRRLITEPDYRIQLGTAGPARAEKLCDPAHQLHRLYEVLSRITARAPIRSVGGLLGDRSALQDG